jgi:hypothetical protein
MTNAEETTSSPDSAPEERKSRPKRKRLWIRLAVLLLGVIGLYFVLPLVWMGLTMLDHSTKPTFREFVRSQPVSEEDFLALFGSDEVWTSRGNSYALGDPPGTEGTEVGRSEFDFRFAHGSEELGHLVVVVEMVMRVHPLDENYEKDSYDYSRGPPELEIDPTGLRVSIDTVTHDPDFHLLVIVCPSRPETFSPDSTELEHDDWGNVEVWAYLLSGPGDTSVLGLAPSGDYIGRPIRPFEKDLGQPDVWAFIGLMLENFMVDPPSEGLVYGIGSGTGGGYERKGEQGGSSNPGGLTARFAQNTTEYSYDLEFEGTCLTEVGPWELGGELRWSSSNNKNLTVNDEVW